MISEERKLVWTTNHSRPDDVMRHLFIDEFIRLGCHHIVTRTWSLDPGDQDEFADRCGKQDTEKLATQATELFVNEGPMETDIFAKLEAGVLLHAYLRRYGTISVTLGMPNLDHELSERWLAKLVEIYPVARLRDDRSIVMKFWMLAPQGPIAIQRTITVPKWGEIAGNYSSDTEQKLVKVMNGFQPSHGGQLLLWHGKPGTGKTFAIRALGLHWKDWCRIECIVDPEMFFGSANYMMSVLMNGGGGEAPEPASSESTPPHELARDGGLWRLLILEDAGELLAEDARKEAGQGLSRMLNLSDGLIGQGLKALMLVTTNEPLRTLHPAVARPGRCASEVEFTNLTAEEARAWFESRSTEALKQTKNMTIAELFGQLEHFKGASGQEREQIGLKKG